jgi:hypothetical protein
MATNAVLHLTDVQPAQSGPYTVVVTNSFGTVTSAPAQLSVFPGAPAPVPRLTLIGETASLLRLEYADAFSPSPSWRLLESVTLTNAAQWYFDLTTPRPTGRFYRAWQSSTSSTPSRLDLKIVSDPYVAPP